MQIGFYSEQETVVVNSSHREQGQLFLKDVHEGNTCLSLGTYDLLPNQTTS
jgi:hypothetical protein